MSAEQIEALVDELTVRRNESLRRVALMVSGPRHRRARPTFQARHRKYVMPLLARVALAFVAVLVPLSAGPRFA